jgi:hypothetical protein
VERSHGSWRCRAAGPPVALAGFVVSAALALYILWKILRTPGDL